MTTWIAQYEAAKYPWFNYSNGSGFYHSDAVWAERLDIPFAFLRGYIRKPAGRRDDRHARPQRSSPSGTASPSEYLELLDGDDRANFETKLGLSRTVFHYVENHNFYVEHWGHSVFWRKMRELSSVFCKEGFWPDVDDIFLLRREEVDDALWDMVGNWATGVRPPAPSHWPAEIARRKGILEACAAWSPPPALGEPPEVVTEPFTIMLWGITRSRSRSGSAACRAPRASRASRRSPGVAEGPARRADQRRPDRRGAGRGDPRGPADGALVGPGLPAHRRAP